MNKKLWLCGKWKSGYDTAKVNNIVWEFQGVFTTRSKAIAACKNMNYFIAPIVLDEEYPKPSKWAPNTDWIPNIQYPLYRRN